MSKRRKPITDKERVASEALFRMGCSEISFGAHAQVAMCCFKKALQENPRNLKAVGALKLMNAMGEYSAREERIRSLVHAESSLA